MNAQDKAVWREHARRRHRPMALFTVLHCWLHGLDGVVFKKPELLRLLGLERVKRSRVNWLNEDFADFFDHRHVIWWEGKTDQQGELNSVASFWVCRHEIPQEVWQGTMPDEQRLAKIPPNGPRIRFFEMWPDASSSDIPRTVPDARLFLGTEGDYDEKLLVSYLSLLCQGLISPQSVPTLLRRATDDPFAELLRLFKDSQGKSPSSPEEELDIDFDTMSLPPKS